MNLTLLVSDSHLLKRESTGTSQLYLTRFMITIPVTSPNSTLPLDKYELVMFIWTRILSKHKTLKYCDIEMAGIP